jgi:hypothetical protein
MRVAGDEVHQAPVQQAAAKNPRLAAEFASETLPGELHAGSALHPPCDLFEALPQ